jgi:hypothetical protein
MNYLNQAFESFAFITALPYFPARSYKPKDKSLVEGAVKIAYSASTLCLTGRSIIPWKN